MDILKFKEMDSEWWWCTGEIWFDLFNNYVKFSVVESADYEYVQKCAQLISRLPVDICNKLCEASTKYCIEFSSSVGNSIPDFQNQNDILKYCSNIGISIPNPDNDNTVAFQVNMYCEWEIEHGMSWAVKDNEIIYVGPYDGSPLNIDDFRNISVGNYDPVNNSV